MCILQLLHSLFKRILVPIKLHSKVWSSPLPIAGASLPHWVQSLPLSTIALMPSPVPKPWSLAQILTRRTQLLAAKVTVAEGLFSLQLRQYFFSLLGNSPSVIYDLEDEPTWLQSELTEGVLSNTRFVPVSISPAMQYGGCTAA
eukprot:Skav210291  [mRNA]  locus=scaffold475:38575:39006:+ [translate_table: standard]